MDLRVDGYSCEGGPPPPEPRSRKMSLSPWDMGGISSGIGMGFGLYRPRRPSYLYATQVNRQRSESYRHAVRRENADVLEQTDDFIDGMLQRKRKESYMKATRKIEDVELESFQNRLTAPELALKPGEVQRNSSLVSNSTKKERRKPKRDTRNSHVVFQEPEESACPSEDGTIAPFVVFTFKKNLVLICISFILTFSAFCAIQNLQSSINSEGYLGIICMSCVHGMMLVTCLAAPSIINKLTAKWALALGMFCDIVWVGANFHPLFYTLIPSALLAGFGQGILWRAEVSYILKLAFDSARVRKDILEYEIFRFHGIFLACFQTTHIWGNLISSLILSTSSKKSPTLKIDDVQTNQCGVLDSCSHDNVLYGKHLLQSNKDEHNEEPDLLYKLMGAYIVLGFVGFLLILLFLDKIGARVDPEKSAYELICQHVSLMFSHKTFRLLIPLLVFTGLQQGFIYADFNRSYVTCTLGIDYVGYCMITMGLANVLSSVMVALCAKYIPREVVLGFGGVVHIGLMIGFLIWIPEKNLLIFFILAASWGVCDAVWQTQCNTLICLTCLDEPDVAFANYRMLQSFGLTIAFAFGTFMCVAAQLYLLMTLLVVAIMCYVLAEYKVRQTDSENNSFDDERH
ncbi:Hypothetical predicted protein [Octopus vulgaris]|uniref:Protein unc-93 homolog A n=2 Tax=Octopus TaxID=6643 RepID=A0AA36BM95_OCTVU|nr:protein unc-93 homolog A [Octopus bimaculoides]CAI9736142.1 Hypothetical predicted protein [Octopus vulgaris]|eukprot:XP_014773019.1 PREDICTED: protein unc-93 homolog A-like [Octopus bimaculoides]